MCQKNPNRKVDGGEGVPEGGMTVSRPGMEKKAKMRQNPSTNLPGVKTRWHGGSHPGNKARAKKKNVSEASRIPIKRKIKERKVDSKQGGGGVIMKKQSSGKSEKKKNKQGDGGAKKKIVSCDQKRTKGYRGHHKKRGWVKKMAERGVPHLCKPTASQGN